MTDSDVAHVDETYDVVVVGARIAGRSPHDCLPSAVYASC